MQKPWVTASKGTCLHKRFQQHPATPRNRRRRIAALERRSRVRTPSVTLLMKQRSINDREAATLIHPTA
jgi:hypothetical protein